MSEIFAAIRLKDKITIASSMVALAIILAVTVGILTSATADIHPHIYDYKLEQREDGGFNVVGICTVDNCETPYFRQDNVSGVNLLSAVSPTCNGEGNKVYTFTYEGVTLKYTEELPVAPHTYIYELVTRNDVIYINGKCTVDGCSDPYLFISGVEDVKLLSAVEGTCFSPRKETYGYTLNGQSYTFVTLVEENIAHTLNKIPASAYADKDGKYLVGTNGIKLFNNKQIACGETADGYYVCERCKQIVTVKVMRPDHKFLYSEENVKAPELTTAGKATLTCHNTECTETVEVVLPPVMVGENAFPISEATEMRRQVVKYSYTSMLYNFVYENNYEVGELLSHIYEYSIEPNLNGSGKMDLVGRCSQPECQTPEIREENIDATMKNTATCISPGEHIWSYEHNGKLLTFILPSFDFAPHDFKYDKSKAQNPTLDNVGLIEIYCSTEGCGHAVILELPKIEIGVNAEIVIENDEEKYIVVDYTYETEHNCTIVLNILIYK